MSPSVLLVIQMRRTGFVNGVPTGRNAFVILASASVLYGSNDTTCVLVMVYPISL